MPSKIALFALLCYAALLVACAQQTQPLPTTIPLALLPTAPPPSPTPLPPTRDISPQIVTPLPTAVPPTPLPTATATPVVPGINITSPDDNVDIVIGSDILIRGLGQADPAHVIWVALISGNGRLLAEAEANKGEVGWQASLSVPQFVTGAAVLQATVRDQNGEILALAETPVNLVLDTTTADRYLALYRPLQGETAVAGFSLFFDGQVFRPVNNTITVSIWADDCQNQVARQSFVLGRSVRNIYWQGFVVVPRDLTGPACAVAYFGVPGEEEWREAQVPITIYPPDAAEARGIRIANPPSGATLTAGNELLLYGTALNASEKPVQVSILLEDGRIVSQSTTVSDYWGYWETSVILPADVDGAAEVTVSTGQPGDNHYAEATIRIIIDPAPPPVP